MADLKKELSDREVKRDQATVAGRKRISLRSLPQRARAYAACGACSVEDAAKPGWKPPAGFFEVEDEHERSEIAELGCLVKTIFSPEHGKVVAVFEGEDPRQKKDKK